MIGTLCSFHILRTPYEVQHLRVPDQPGKGVGTLLGQGESRTHPVPGREASSPSRLPGRPGLFPRPKGHVSAGPGGG